MNQKTSLKSIVFLALVCNATMMFVVQDFSKFAALATCAVLSIFSAILLANCLRSNQASKIEKLSIVMVSMFSIGLMALSYSVNAADISLNSTRSFELMLIFIFLCAAGFGIVSYLIRDL